MVLDRLRQWMAAPRFADPEIDRIARSTYACAIAFLGILLLWVPFAYFGQDHSLHVFAVGGTGGLVLAAIALLARRGRARIAAAIMVALIVFMATIGLWIEGGLRSSSTSTFLSAVVAAGLFFSARAAVGVGVVSSVILLGFWQLEIAGALPPPADLDSERFLIGNLTLIAIVVVMVQQTVGRIREAQGFLQRVADATPHAIYVFDLEEGKLAYGNAHTTTQLGYEAAPLQQNTPMLIIHPDDQAGLARKVGSLARSGSEGPELVEHEYRAQAADGSWRWLHARFRVFHRNADGTVRQVLGTAEDVTEIRASEQELERSQQRLRRAERMEALGQLAGGIAHDFNNYLTVIMGGADAARRSVEHDPQLSMLLEDIGGAARRSADLTRQLLAFSRHQLLQPRPIDLREVLGDAERLLRRVIPENIEIHIHAAPELGRIHADPAQIEQIIFNLAVNARDAMPRGGHITLEASNVELDEREVAGHPDASAGPHVCLRVIDDGAGMDEETQRKIFEPLFTTKEAGTGTGFGLATVEAIVRQCGGLIEVESEVGAGSSFSTFWPRLEGNEEPVTPQPAEERPILLGEEHVLLVEDEGMVRNFARRSLESCGYRVMDVPNGEEALEAFTDGPEDFDVVLTDVMMPGMSGLELASKLREQRPAIPIVFMSGYTASDLTTTGIDPKEQVLNKPFTIVDLQQRIRQAIDENHAAD